MLRRKVKKRKQGIIRKNIKEVRKNIRGIATPLIGEPNKGKRIGLLAQKTKRSHTPTTKKKTTKKKTATKKKKSVKKLPKMAEKYAKQISKTTGLSIAEVKKSKPFKSYVKALTE